jgi:hypothetical protein
MQPFGCVMQIWPSFQFCFKFYDFEIHYTNSFTMILIQSFFPSVEWFLIKYISSTCSKTYSSKEVLNKRKLDKEHSNHHASLALPK